MDPSLYPTNILYLNFFPHNLMKFLKSKEPIFISKQKITQYLIFFYELGKIDMSISRATLKTQKCLCELEKVWNYSLGPALKNPNLESWDKFGKSSYINYMMFYTIRCVK